MRTAERSDGHTLRDAFLGLWGMARPVVLVSNVMAWILGASIALGTSYAVDWARLGWGFIAMIAVSASVHYANEYADHETDALTERTLFSGGSGVLPKGLVSRDLAFRAACVTLALGLTVGSSAVFIRVLPFSALVVLTVGASGGWMYSLPPFKLAWRFLGEFTNAFLGGILLPLHGYITVTGRFDLWVVLACLPFSFLCFNNLLAVTWPDRHADAQVGKMTLATLWSEERLRRLYLIVAFASFATLLLLSWWIIPFEVAVVSIFSLPHVIHGYTTYTKNKVSSSTVYAMMVMMLTQTLTWIVVGFGITLW